MSGKKVALVITWQESA